MTLSEAQKNFRAAPSRATALAYMDAALCAWWNEPLTMKEAFDADAVFHDNMQEIRDWLMNYTPQVGEVARL